jgi:hypothetical protein
MKNPVSHHLDVITATNKISSSSAISLKRLAPVSSKKYPHPACLIIRYKVMNKKFHCGRLLLNKNRSVKKIIDLAIGGGTLDFISDHIDMNFNEIHDYLCKFYLNPIRIPKK